LTWIDLDKNVKQGKNSSSLWINQNYFSKKRSEPNLTLYGNRLLDEYEKSRGNVLFLNWTSEIIVPGHIQGRAE